MKILKNDPLYKLIVVLSRIVFPQLRILRLADRKAAGMDKLFFYVRKADVMLKDKDAVEFNENRSMTRWLRK
jgi:hypothetical protein